MNTLLKLSLAILLLTSINTADLSAQSVNGVNIEEIDTPYLFVSSVSRLLNNSVNLSINYGQEMRLNDMRSTGLLDRDGKAIKFNSIVHGLNYLYSFGYRLDETLVDPNGGGVTYILEKVE